MWTSNSIKQSNLTSNGQKYSGIAEPRTLLAYFLRDELGLTGTHIGCIVGKCGACTIILNGKAVKSCMLFALQAEGAEILTVEGLAKGSQLHPIQEAFWEHHGLQCVYCTPGQICSSVGMVDEVARGVPSHVTADLGASEIVLDHDDLLQRNPNPSEEEIREGISGNLCMCTGYVDIVKAVKAAAEKMAPVKKSKARS
jgi:carbon-monoxide dehydrogenase small subunit